MSNDGQSNTKIDENEDFSAISAALTGGDTAELDRLMAAKEGTETTDEVNEEDSQDETNTHVESTDGNNDDDTSTDGAAEKTAAQTANTAQEPNEVELLKQELHRLKSDAGRVAHLQRTVQQLERQLRANTEARSAQPNEPKSNEKKDIPEHLRKKIDSLKEIDPDLADTFEAFAKTMVETAEARANEVRQTVEERHQEQEDIRFWQEQKAELYRMVPRCDEVFQMPEWHDWKEQLSPGVRGLIESGHAKDMATAIQMFAHHYQTQRGTQQRAASSEGGDPNATNATAANTQANQEVVEARARKVGTAAGVKSSAAKKEAELDPEAQFREIYRKLAKDNHIA